MRRIALLILLPVVAYTATIGYLRHEVASKTDKLIATAAPFASIDYESVHTSLLGDEVGLDGITIRPTMTSDVFEVGAVRITAPHIGFFLGIEDDISDLQELEGIALEIQDLNFDIDSDLIAFILAQGADAKDSSASGIEFERWEALGCGDHGRFMPADYRNMGIGSIPLDLVWSIEEEAVVMYINADDLFSLDISVMHDDTFGIDEAMMGEVISETTFTYVDKGIHELRNVYCSDLNDSEIEDYVDLHTSLLFNELGLYLPKKSRAAYKDYMLKGGTIVMSINPTRNVPTSNLSYYSLPEVVEILGVNITINEQRINWDKAKWSESAQQSNANVKERPIATTTRDTFINKPNTRRNNDGRTEPTFHTIAVTSAHKHIGRKAKVTLHNGISRSGRIENVNDWRIKIAVKRQSGTMSYTVKRGDIVKLKVYY